MMCNVINYQANRLDVFTYEPKSIMKTFRYLRRSIFALVFGVIFSCNDDDNNKAPVIDPELKSFVDTFVQEASQRGKTISLNNLTVSFEPTGDVCGRGSVSPLKVTIYKSCWSTLPDIAKEILMFHELGHSLLKRSHDSRKLPNGDYTSIMYEDPTILYNEYTPAKRTYYLDELFGVVTTLPQWTAEKKNESIILADEILNNGSWTYTVSGSPNHEGSVVDSEYASPDNSLAINSAGSATGFSYWTYSFIPTDIEEGSAVVLKVKIKAVNLNGGGAFFALRGDVNEKDYPILFYTTQDKPVLGNTNFGESEYFIKVNYFPSKVDKLRIFLILDGTSSGAVYFDDIQLLKYE